ncbi:MAG: hypothetical protein RBT80_17070 [Candidatus Vecturithrix sp.]|nr:hypothetical protein [Candidatus Vecturithrix sp.]
MSMTTSCGIMAAPTTHGGIYQPTAEVVHFLNPLMVHSLMPGDTCDSFSAARIASTLANTA